MTEEQRKVEIRAKIQLHRVRRPEKPHKSANSRFDVQSATFLDLQVGHTVPAYNPDTKLLDYVPTNWKIDEHIFLERRQFSSYEAFADFRLFADLQWSRWHLLIARWWGELASLSRELNGTDRSKKEQRRQSIGIPAASEWVDILNKE